MSFSYHLIQRSNKVLIFVLSISFLVTLFLIQKTKLNYLQHDLPSTSSSFKFQLFPQQTWDDPHYIQLLNSLPSPDRIQNNLRWLTSKPHMAGTKEGNDLALKLAKQFSQENFQVEILEYYPYLNTPKSLELSLISSTDNNKELWKAVLQEPVIKEDKDTEMVSEFSLPFFGYSATGNVTGPLIYANYGRLEDFNLLKVRNITLKGSIALIRHGGGIFRGIKVMAAQKFGIIGCIIFSDPMDDGYHLGKVYPEGKFRPEWGVQRGSSRFISLGSGDALTPGYPATKHAKRIKLEDVKMLPKIPAIPLSYGNAKVLLQHLDNCGLNIERLGWEKGGLPIDYFTGPTINTQVNLLNIMTGDIKKISNVIATIPSSNKDSNNGDNLSIMFGNHHDAWLLGAIDPGSGTAIQLEVASCLNQLINLGWKPKKTIQLMSWDGEEFGAIGSTEYVEDKVEYLKKRGLIYINIDNIEGDYFSGSGSPSLNEVLYKTTKKVSFKDRSLFDDWASHFKDKTPRLRALGAGSDYTPFYSHVGIPSLSLKFQQKSGIYHSLYDTYKYSTAYGNPNATSLNAMTQLILHLIVKLSDDPILPFDILNYAKDLQYYWYENVLKPKLLGHQFSKEASKVTNIWDELVKVATVLKKEREMLEKLPCDQSTDTVAAYKFDRCLAIRSYNSRIRDFEFSLIDPKGLPNRTWFQHKFFAPGLWSGYGAQVFPGLFDAIEDNNTDLIKDTLSSYVDTISKAIEKLLVHL